MLTSNMISRENITNLSFLQSLHFFSYAFVYTSFFSGHSTMSTVERINLKVFVRLGKTPSLASEKLQQVFGENTVLCNHIFEWYKRFKEGHEDVKMTLGVGIFQQAGLKSTSSG